jgi:hypothetical protein
MIIYLYPILLHVLFGGLCISRITYLLLLMSIIFLGISLMGLTKNKGTNPSGGLCFSVGNLELPE